MIGSANTTCSIQKDYMQVVPSSSRQRVDIQFDILIPKQQEIIYKPTTIESLKMAWIQYLALLIPSLWVIYKCILGFAFSNKVLDAQIKNDIKDEILTYDKGFLYSRKF
jgi:Transmembrane protein 231